MTTVSFSIENDIKRDIDRWARHGKKSKSAVLRDMVAMYRFNEQLDYHTSKIDKVLRELNIQTEDELYEYLESDETYEDRMRHQRLSSRQQNQQLRAPAAQAV